MCALCCLCNTVLWMSAFRCPLSTVNGRIELSVVYCVRALCCQASTVGSSEVAAKEAKLYGDVYDATTLARTTPPQSVSLNDAQVWQKQNAVLCWETVTAVSTSYWNSQEDLASHQYSARIRVNRVTRWYSLFCCRIFALVPQPAPACAVTTASFTLNSACKRNVSTWCVNLRVCFKQLQSVFSVLASNCKSSVSGNWCSFCVQ